LAVIITEGSESLIEQPHLLPIYILYLEMWGWLRGSLIWESLQNTRNSSCARNAMNAALKILEKGKFEPCQNYNIQKSSTAFRKNCFSLSTAVKTVDGFSITAGICLNL